MSENERHDPVDSSEASDASLDRLLARARWEAPTATEEYRLREQWIHLRRRRRIAPVRYLAAAAAVVVVMGTMMLLRSEPQERAELVPANPKMLVIHGDEDPTSLIPSRPATAYELLIAMQSGGAANAPATVASRDARVLEPGVQKLVDQLGDPLVNRRYEAARELARADEPAVVPVLQEMVQEGVNRREALAALLLSQDPRAARALAEVRLSRTIDAQVIALRTELQ